MGLGSAKVLLGSIAIANGATESAEVPFNRLRFLRSLTITAPATLTGTVTVEISPTRVDGVDDFVALQSAGADVTVAAGKATVIEPIPAARLRLSSSLAEGAERSFDLIGAE